MVSDVYILTFTLIKKYLDETAFHKFVVNAFPSCIKDHLPRCMEFHSIEYKKDFLIDSFLEMLVDVDLDSLNEMKTKGLEIESGMFHLKLAGDEDFTRRTLLSVEFVLQKLHESYSFITSHMYYLDEDSIKRFVKMSTFETDTEEEEYEFEYLQDYTFLLESYLYDGVIPDCYADEVAKMMLLQGRI